MKIEKESMPVVPGKPLKNLKPGDVFRFSIMDYDEAVQENAIFMVVSGSKDSRIQIVNLFDGLLLVRDDCHLVNQMDARMVITE